MKERENISDAGRQPDNGGTACLECGDIIVYGRADKKFCCEACKNRYHNRLAGYARNYRRKVNSALDRNHFILDSLRRTSMKHIRMDDLKRMGLRPEYFTSYTRTSANEIFMCYDIRYYVRNGIVTSIVKVNR